MRALIIILLISVSACSDITAESISSTEQSYEISALSKYGMSCNFYFNYLISDVSETDEVNKRIAQELLKIADERKIVELVNAIDSIGPMIEKEIDGEFELEDLAVRELGVEEFVKDYLTEAGANVDRIKIVNDLEVTNFASSSDLKFEEKSKSESISMILKTKYDSKVPIEYSIYFTEELGSNLPVKGINKQIETTIIDALDGYEMYEMWATKKDSMELTMTQIIKSKYPETNRVEILNVTIPDEAMQQFSATNKAKMEITDELLEVRERKNMLNKRLEANEGLTPNEISSIEKEIEILEAKQKAIQKKGRLLKDEYKF